jgi:hypothetical protein
MRLNARKRFNVMNFQDTRTLLPHLQSLPQDKREKADKNMRLHAIFAVMPDRTHTQFVFLNAKRRFSLRKGALPLRILPG